MKKPLPTTVELILTWMLFGWLSTQAKAADRPTYFFTTEANEWTQAIPIGNGRLGGMVYGGVQQERIQTNDDTFWSGEPRDYQKPGTYQHLPFIRQQLLMGNTSLAAALVDSFMLGPYNESYMPLADIILNFDNTGTATEYKRSLDLEKGVVTINYLQNGVRYKREMIASFPDQAIVIHLTADQAKSINLTANLTSLVQSSTVAENNQLIINGQAPKRVEPNYTGIKTIVYEKDHGTRFQGRLIITDTDGKLTQASGTLTLEQASKATLTFVAATSFNGFDKNPYTQGKDEKVLCQAQAHRATANRWPTVLNRHIRDFSALSGRVSLQLGSSDEANEPIDKRIATYQPGKDPALISLYYQFGRYLLLSSSRPGSQPANLQGIWNYQIQPAWSANWTINCNAEINYWPVESANLSECHLPLMELIREITVDGAKTAKNLYDCRGWVAHHNIDLWRSTWPVDGTGKWAIFQVGGAWLCQHIWDHYQFTQDKNFLKDFYPILRDASLFYLDNLQTDHEGFLVTSPSVSFENIYKKANGETGWVCMGPAQDMQILRSLFLHTLAAQKILGVDRAFGNNVQTALDKLPPIKVSPTTGFVQEWNDDWEPQNPHNGQITQGWGLVASDLITLRGTPALAEAFRKTIRHRKPWLAENSGSWTGAFASAFWVRLGEGDSTLQVIDRHFKLALYPNLTCKFADSWQIDGNLGMTSAIGEMLLQSQGGELSILPALPSRFPTGEVKGLMARGGYQVDIAWEKGRAKRIRILAKTNNDTCRLFAKNIVNAKATDHFGHPISLQVLSPDQIAFRTIKGTSYTFLWP